MSNVYAGYRGLADIAGVGQVRFSDASISAKQTVEAPDLIAGTWNPSAYYFGKIEVGGSISGPVTETFISGSGGGSGVWRWGSQRSSPCGLMTADALTLYYYCGGSESRGRQFTNMLVNTMGFSCAAGDVAQFNIDVMGNGLGPDDGWITSDPPLFEVTEKLLMWDKVHVSITPGSNPEFTPPANIAYSNFDLSIANNLQPVYSLGQPNLFPYEIVPGIRRITGSISVYNTPRSDGKDTWDDYLATDLSVITFNIGGIVIDLNVRFHRVEPASSVSSIVSTIGFSCVGPQPSIDS